MDIFEDPDGALEFWLTNVNSILDNRPPMKIKRVKYSFKPKWLTKDIISAIARRNSNKKRGDYRNYHSWRNNVLRMIKIAKREYYISQIGENRCDTRKLWKLIKEVFPTKVLSTSTILQANWNIINDELAIAEQFNDFFSNIR